MTPRNVSPEAQALVHPVRELLEKRTVPCPQMIGLPKMHGGTYPHGIGCPDCNGIGVMPDPRFAQLLHVIREEGIAGTNVFAVRCYIERDWTSMPYGALAGAIDGALEDEGCGEFYSIWEPLTHKEDDTDLAAITALKATLEALHG